MLNTKIFFFDIDWTLLDHNNETVHDLSYCALDQLKAKGYTLVACTSRSPQEMRNLPQKLLNYFDAKLMGAGTYIEIDNKLEVKFIERNILDKVINYLETNNITYRYCLENGIGYINKEDPIIQKRFDRVYYFHPDTKPYENEDVTMIVYYANENQCKDIETIASNTGTARIHVGGEIYPKNIDKGEIMCEITRRFGFTQDETFAIGDGLNDISMLQKAKIGVAMANSQIETQKAADYVTDDVKDDGVYKALKHFGYIQ